MVTMFTTSQISDKRFYIKSHQSPRTLHVTVFGEWQHALLVTRNVVTVMLPKNQISCMLSHGFDSFADDSIFLLFFLLQNTLMAIIHRTLLV
jgi:type 1 glutamine amidotransferase